MLQAPPSVVRVYPQSNSRSRYPSIPRPLGAAFSLYPISPGCCLPPLPGCRLLPLSPIHWMMFSPLSSILYPCFLPLSLIPWVPLAPSTRFPFAPSILYPLDDDLSSTPYLLGDACSLRPLSPGCRLLPLSGCRLAPPYPTPWFYGCCHPDAANPSISYPLGVNAIRIPLRPSILDPLSVACPPVFCCLTPLCPISPGCCFPLRNLLVARFLRRWRWVWCLARGGRGGSTP